MRKNHKITTCRPSPVPIQICGNSVSDFYFKKITHYKGQQIQFFCILPEFFKEARQELAKHINADLQIVLVKTASHGEAQKSGLIKELDLESAQDGEDRFLWYNAKAKVRDKFVETGWLSGGEYDFACDAASHCAMYTLNVELKHHTDKIVKALEAAYQRQKY